MKINRAKLNAMLRSGLHPEISTRKQLAGYLCLDPTSLTRWFATTDSAGNPRYPVVPDRHVLGILQLFGLTPDSLNLTDEDFRQFCLEQALAKKESIEQTTNTVMPSAISEVKSRWNLRWQFLSVAMVIVFGISVVWFSLPDAKNDLESIIAEDAKAILEQGIKEMRGRNFSIALKNFTTATDKLAVLENEEHPLYKQIQFNQGLALYGLGEWRAARLHFQRTVLNKKQVLDAESNHEFANRARGAARGEIEQGRKFLVLGYLYGAIEHDKNYFGNDHPIMADNWLLLAQALMLQNQLDQALGVAENARNLDRQLFGPVHPRVAEDEITLAVLALQQGNVNQAYRLYTSALQIFTKLGLEYNHSEIQKSPKENSLELLLLQGLQLLDTAQAQSLPTTDLQNLRATITQLDAVVNINTPYMLRRLAAHLRQYAVSQHYL